MAPKHKKRTPRRPSSSSSEPSTSSSSSEPSTSSSSSSLIGEAVAFATYAFNKAKQAIAEQAVADARNGKHQEALGIIKKMCKNNNNSSFLYRFQAEISYICASKAKISVKSEHHRRNTITCARRAIRLDPDSLELVHILALYLYKFANDSNGLNEAVQECRKGIEIANRSDKDKDNWEEKLLKLIESCELKLKELEQPETHQETQVDQKTEILKQEKVQNDDNCAKEKPETEKNSADLHSNSSESCLLRAHRARLVDDGAQDLCSRPKSLRDNKRKQSKTAEILMYQNQQSLPDDSEPESPHAAVFSDRTLLPKNCKVKEPNKRDMTCEEKETLCKNLQNIPHDKLASVVLILEKRNSPSCQCDDVIEVDIDALDAETLWELQSFVTTYNKSSSKNKAEVPVQSRQECRHYPEEMKMASAVAEVPAETKLGPGREGILTVGDLNKKNKKDDQSRLLEATSAQQESGEVPEQFFNEVIEEMQKRMVSFQNAGEALKQLDTECVQSLLNVNAQLDEFAETASKFLPSANNLEDKGVS